MTTLPQRLSETDIRRLVKGDSVDERAAAAHKLCRAVERAALSSEDRAAAEGIIRVLACDAAEMVRRALAVTLKTSDLLPRDVAMRLARDLESVALPIINASPVFTDEDLVEIIKTGAPNRQVAVAERATLSKRVTAAVAIHGVEAAVIAACANDNAKFAEASLQRAIDRFPRSDEVKNTIAYRSSLPVAISERLVSIVSDAVRQHLVERHALKLETAMRLTTVARERITVDLVDQAVVTTDFAAFAQHLHEHQRLTPSLLLRAIARGQMLFFEHAVAELSGIPHSRTWLMVHDAGPLGFKAIYERAGLPTRLFAAFRSALDCWRAVESEGANFDRDIFQERVLQRFLTSQPYASREDLNYLLERIDRPSDSARPVRHANAA